MPVNIGPRIGIEGEAEYRRTINQIIQQQKTLKSEMQAMSSAWDKDTAQQKKNSQQRDILSKQIQTQKDRLAELENMMEKSAEKYGEEYDAKVEISEELDFVSLVMYLTKNGQVPSGMESFDDITLAFLVEWDQVSNCGRYGVTLETEKTIRLTEAIDYSLNDLFDEYKPQ